MNFQDSFFVANNFGSKKLNILPWISQICVIKSITDSFWESRWYIHLDGLSNYLYLFWKQPVFSVFRNNNYCFPDQGNVHHHTNQKSYRRRSCPIHQIPFETHFIWIFAASKASLVVQTQNGCTRSTLEEKNQGSEQFLIVFKKG